MSVKELEQKAIERLKCFEPPAEQEPYYIAYSGGKDSDTIRNLITAQTAGRKWTEESRSDKQNKEKEKGEKN